MMWLLIAGIIAGGVCLGLLGLIRIDKEHGMEFTPNVFFCICAGSMVAGLIWSTTINDGDWKMRLAFLVIHIYFLSCSVTDHLTCQVYDIFQYLGIMAATYLALVKTDEIMIGCSILLFSLIQYFLFMKLYGKADGMAFLVAALTEGALGCDINAYFLHMIMAYLMLSLVQVLRGNIGARGHLKKPVPFLPYITVSFWMILIYAEELTIYL